MKEFSIPSEWLKQITQKVNSRLRKRFEENFGRIDRKFSTKGQKGSKIIDLYLSIIEKEIEIIASKFNRFGLLVAMHHLSPPLPLLFRGKNFFGDSQEIFVLCCLAAMKYASKPSNAQHVFTREDYFSSTKGPFKLTATPAIIKKVFEFEELVKLLHEGQKQYRLVEKGAKVEIDFSKRLSVSAIPSNEQLRLAIEYDNRAIREFKRNFLAGLGGYSPLAVPPTNFPAIPIVNINWGKLSDPRNEKLSVTHWIDVIPIYGSLFLLRREFEKQFKGKIYIEDFIVFLLTSFEIVKEMEDKGEALYGLGYDFTRIDTFLEFIVHSAPQNYASLLNQTWKDFGDTSDLPIVLESLNPSWWKNQSPKIFDLVSVGENEAKEINLRILTPVSYLFKLESENTAFFAYNAVGQFLINLWRPIQKEGEFYALKGKDFEIWVNNKLKVLNGVEEICPPGKKLRNVGSKKETDLDVFVGKEDFVFPISCKGYYLNERYLLGSGQEYFTMWKRAERWLNEIDEIGNHILDNARSLKLPEKYRYILPLVCTSHPVYILEEVEKLRLPNGVPRICTLTELEDFILNLEKYEKFLVDTDYVLKMGN